MLHLTENNFFNWLDSFSPEFHHSKDEIQALLFQPGCFSLRNLNRVEKSAQQKDLFFPEILPRSLGAADTSPQIAAHV